MITDKINYMLRQLRGIAITLVVIFLLAVGAYWYQTGSLSDALEHVKAIGKFFLNLARIG